VGEKSYQERGIEGYYPNALRAYSNKVQEKAQNKPLMGGGARRTEWTPPQKWSTQSRGTNITWQV